MASTDSNNFSGTEEIIYRPDYSEFYNAQTKLRSENYLKIIGDKAFQASNEAFKFSNGDPNPLCSPYQKVSVILKNGEILELVGKVLEDALGYMTIKGYQPFLDLLKYFQDHLHGKQNWEIKNITTTSGSQGALYQIIEMFVSPGEPVLVQSPFYPGMISILQHLQVEFLEVDNDLSGISVQHLATILYERKIQGLAMPKIFYINPTGTNPTGEIISLEKKKEIYKIACEYNLLILEDDPYFLLTYENKIPVSFLALDTENRVIRFDSFSKTLGAGFRIGYVTAAKEIIDKLNLIKGSSAMASPFCQVIVHNTLASMKFNGFLHHMRSISEFYRKNCEKVLYCLNKYMKDVAVWNAPEAAMFVWITIKHTDHISDEFIDTCIKNLVLVCPGFAFYGKGRGSPCIRLAFSMINEHRIEEGVRRLSYLIKQELNKH